MLRRAFGFLPGLASLAALRTWVGFRPATPDKLPLIGSGARDWLTSGTGTAWTSDPVMITWPASSPVSKRLSRLAISICRS